MDTQPPAEGQDTQFDDEDEDCLCGSQCDCYLCDLDDEKQSCVCEPKPAPCDCATISPSCPCESGDVGAGLDPGAGGLAPGQGQPASSGPLGAGMPGQQPASGPLTQGQESGTPGALGAGTEPPCDCIIVRQDCPCDVKDDPCPCEDPVPPPGSARGAPAAPGAGPPCPPQGAGDVCAPVCTPCVCPEDEESREQRICTVAPPGKPSTGKPSRLAMIDQDGVEKLSQISAQQLAQDPNAAQQAPELTQPLPGQSMPAEPSDIPQQPSQPGQVPSEPMAQVPSQPMSQTMSQPIPPETGEQPCACVTASGLCICSHSDDPCPCEDPALAPAYAAKIRQMQSQEMQPVPSGQVSEPMQQVPSAEMSQPLQQMPSGEMSQPMQQMPSGQMSEPMQQVPSGEMSQPMQQMPSAEMSQPMQQMPSAEMSQPMQQMPSAEMSQPMQQMPLAEMSQPMQQMPSEQMPEPMSIQQVPSSQQVLQQPGLEPCACITASGTCICDHSDDPCPCEDPALAPAYAAKIQQMQSQQMQPMEQTPSGQMSQPMQQMPSEQMSQPMQQMPSEQMSQPTSMQQVPSDQMSQPMQQMPSEQMSAQQTVGDECLCIGTCECSPEAPMLVTSQKMSVAPVPSQPMSQASQPMGPVASQPMSQASQPMAQVPSQPMSQTMSQPIPPETGEQPCACVTASGLCICSHSDDPCPCEDPALAPAYAAKIQQMQSQEMQPVPSGQMPEPMQQMPSGEMSQPMSMQQMPSGQMSEPMEQVPPGEMSQPMQQMPSAEMSQPMQQMPSEQMPEPMSIQQVPSGQQVLQQPGLEACACVTASGTCICDHSDDPCPCEDPALAPAYAAKIRQMQSQPSAGQSFPDQPSQLSQQEGQPPQQPSIHSQQPSQASAGAGDPCTCPEPCLCTPESPMLVGEGIPSQPMQQVPSQPMQQMESQQMQPMEQTPSGQMSQPMSMQQMPSDQMSQPMQQMPSGEMSQPMQQMPSDQMSQPMQQMPSEQMPEPMSIQQVPSGQQVLQQPGLEACACITASGTCICDHSDDPCPCEDPALAPAYAAKIQQMQSQQMQPMQQTPSGQMSQPMQQMPSGEMSQPMSMQQVPSGEMSQPMQQMPSEQMSQPTSMEQVPSGQQVLQQPGLEACACITASGTCICDHSDDPCPCEDPALAPAYAAKIQQMQSQQMQPMQQTPSGQMSQPMQQMPSGEMSQPMSMQQMPSDQMSQPMQQMPSGEMTQPMQQMPSDQMSQPMQQMPSEQMPEPMSIQQVPSGQQVLQQPGLEACACVTASGTCICDHSDDPCPCEDPALAAAYADKIRQMQSQPSAGQSFPDQPSQLSQQEGQPPQQPSIHSQQPSQASAGAGDPCTCPEPCLCTPESPMLVGEGIPSQPMQQVPSQPMQQMESQQMQETPSQPMQIDPQEAPLQTAQGPEVPSQTVPSPGHEPCACVTASGTCICEHSDDPCPCEDPSLAPAYAAKIQQMQSQQSQPMQQAPSVQQSVGPIVCGEGDRAYCEVCTADKIPECVCGGDQQLQQQPTGMPEGEILNQPSQPSQPSQVQSQIGGQAGEQPCACVTASGTCICEHSDDPCPCEDPALAPAYAAKIQQMQSEQTQPMQQTPGQMSQPMSMQQVPSGEMSQPMQQMPSEQMSQPMSMQQVPSGEMSQPVQQIPSGEMSQPMSMQQVPSGQQGLETCACVTASGTCICEHSDDPCPCEDPALAPAYAAKIRQMQSQQSQPMQQESPQAMLASPSTDDPCLCPVPCACESGEGSLAPQVPSQPMPLQPSQSGQEMMSEASQPMPLPDQTSQHSQQPQFGQQPAQMPEQLSQQRQQEQMPCACVTASGTCICEHSDDPCPCEDPSLAPAYAAKIQQMQSQQSQPMQQAPTVQQSVGPIVCGEGDRAYCEVCTADKIPECVCGGEQQLQQQPSGLSEGEILNQPSQVQSQIGGQAGEQPCACVTASGTCICEHSDDPCPCEDPALAPAYAAKIRQMQSQQSQPMQQESPQAMLASPSTDDPCLCPVPCACESGEGSLAPQVPSQPMPLQPSQSGQEMMSQASQPMPLPDQTSQHSEQPQFGQQPAQMPEQLSQQISQPQSQQGQIPCACVTASGTCICEHSDDPCPCEDPSLAPAYAAKIQQMQSQQSEPMQQAPTVQQSVGPIVCGEGDRAYCEVCTADKIPECVCGGDQQLQQQPTGLPEGEILNQPSQPSQPSQVQSQIGGQAGEQPCACVTASGTCICEHSDDPCPCEDPALAPAYAAKIQQMQSEQTQPMQQTPGQMSQPMSMQQVPSGEMSQPMQQMPSEQMSQPMSMQQVPSGEMSQPVQQIPSGEMSQPMSMQQVPSGQQGLETCACVTASGTCICDHSDDPCPCEDPALAPAYAAKIRQMQSQQSQPMQQESPQAMLASPSTDDPCLCPVPCACESGEGSLAPQVPSQPMPLQPSQSGQEIMSQASQPMPLPDQTSQHSEQPQFGQQPAQMPEQLSQQISQPQSQQGQMPCACVTASGTCICEHSDDPCPCEDPSLAPAYAAKIQQMQSQQSQPMQQAPTVQQSVGPIVCGEGDRAYCEVCTADKIPECVCGGDQQLQQQPTGLPEGEILNQPSQPSQPSQVQSQIGGQAGEQPCACVTASGTCICEHSDDPCPCEDPALAPAYAAKIRQMQSQQSQPMQQESPQAMLASPSTDDPCLCPVPCACESGEGSLAPHVPSQPMPLQPSQSGQEMMSQPSQPMSLPDQTSQHSQQPQFSQQPAQMPEQLSQQISQPQSQQGQMPCACVTASGTCICEHSDDPCPCEDPSLAPAYAAKIQQMQSQQSQPMEQVPSLQQSQQPQPTQQVLSVQPLIAANEDNTFLSSFEPNVDEISMAEFKSFTMDVLFEHVIIDDTDHYSPCPILCHSDSMCDFCAGKKEICVCDKRQLEPSYSRLLSDDSPPIETQNFSQVQVQPQAEELTVTAPAERPQVCACVTASGTCICDHSDEPCPCEDASLAPAYAAKIQQMQSQQSQPTQQALPSQTRDQFGDQPCACVTASGTCICEHSDEPCPCEDPALSASYAAKIRQMQLSQQPQIPKEPSLHSQQAQHQQPSQLSQPPGPLVPADIGATTAQPTSQPSQSSQVVNADDAESPKYGRNSQEKCDRLQTIAPAAEDGVNCTDSENECEMGPPAAATTNEAACMCPDVCACTETVDACTCVDVSQATQLGRTGRVPVNKATQLGSTTAGMPTSPATSRDIKGEIVELPQKATCFCRGTQTDVGDGTPEQTRQTAKTAENAESVPEKNTHAKSLNEEFSTSQPCCCDASWGLCTRFPPAEVSCGCCVPDGSTENQPGQPNHICSGNRCAEDGSPQAAPKPVAEPSAPQSQGASPPCCCDAYWGLCTRFPPAEVSCGCCVPDGSTENQPGQPNHICSGNRCGEDGSPHAAPKPVAEPSAPQSQGASPPCCCDAYWGLCTRFPPAEVSCGCCVPDGSTENQPGQPNHICSGNRCGEDGSPHAAPKPVAEPSAPQSQGASPPCCCDAYWGLCTRFPPAEVSCGCCVPDGSTENQPGQPNHICSGNRCAEDGSPQAAPKPVAEPSAPQSQGASPPCCCDAYWGLCTRFPPAEVSCGCCVPDGSTENQPGQPNHICSGNRCAEDGSPQAAPKPVTEPSAPRIQHGASPSSDSEDENSLYEDAIEGTDEQPTILAGEISPVHEQIANNRKCICNGPEVGPKDPQSPAHAAPAKSEKPVRPLSVAYRAPEPPEETCECIVKHGTCPCRDVLPSANVQDAASQKKVDCVDEATEYEPQLPGTLEKSGNTETSIQLMTETGMSPKSQEPSAEHITEPLPSSKTESTVNKGTQACCCDVSWGLCTRNPPVQVICGCNVPDGAAEDQSEQPNYICWGNRCAEEERAAAAPPPFPPESRSQQEDSTSIEGGSDMTFPCECEEDEVSSSDVAVEGSLVQVTAVVPVTTPPAQEEAASERTLIHKDVSRTTGEAKSPEPLLRSVTDPARSKDVPESQTQKANYGNATDVSTQAAASEAMRQSSESVSKKTSTQVEPLDKTAVTEPVDSHLPTAEAPAKCTAECVSLCKVDKPNSKDAECKASLSSVRDAPSHTETEPSAKKVNDQAQHCGCEALQTEGDGHYECVTKEGLCEGGGDGPCPCEVTGKSAGEEAKCGTVGDAVEDDDCTCEELEGGGCKCDELSSKEGNGGPQGDEAEDDCTCEELESGGCVCDEDASSAVVVPTSSSLPSGDVGKDTEEFLPQIGVESVDAVTEYEPEQIRKSIDTSPDANHEESPDAGPDAGPDASGDASPDKQYQSYKWTAPPGCDCITCRCGIEEEEEVGNDIKASPDNKQEDKGLEQPTAAVAKSSSLERASEQFVGEASWGLGSDHPPDASGRPIPDQPPVRNCVCWGIVEAGEVTPSPGSAEQVSQNPKAEAGDGASQRENAGENVNLETRDEQLTKDTELWSSLQGDTCRSRNQEQQTEPLPLCECAGKNVECEVQELTSCIYEDKEQQTEILAVGMIKDEAPEPIPPAADCNCISAFLWCENDDEGICFCKEGAGKLPQDQGENITQGKKEEPETPAQEIGRKEPGACLATKSECLCSTSQTRPYACVDEPTAEHAKLAIEPDPDTAPTVEQVSEPENVADPESAKREKEPCTCLKDQPSQCPCNEDQAATLTEKVTELEQGTSVPAAEPETNLEGKEPCACVKTKGDCVCIATQTSICPCDDEPPVSEMVTLEAHIGPTEINIEPSGQVPEHSYGCVTTNGVCESGRDGPCLCETEKSDLPSVIETPAPLPATDAHETCKCQKVKGTCDCAVNTDPCPCEDKEQFTDETYLVLATQMKQSQREEHNTEQEMTERGIGSSSAPEVGVKPSKCNCGVCTDSCTNTHKIIQTDPDGFVDGLRTPAGESQPPCDEVKTSQGEETTRERPDPQPPPGRPDDEFQARASQEPFPVESVSEPATSEQSAAASQEVSCTYIAGQGPCECLAGDDACICEQEQPPAEDVSCTYIAGQGPCECLAGDDACVCEQEQQPSKAITPSASGEPGGDQQIPCNFKAGIGSCDCLKKGENCTCEYAEAAQGMPKESGQGLPPESCQVPPEVSSSIHPPGMEVASWQTAPGEVETETCAYLSKQGSCKCSHKPTCTCYEEYPSTPPEKMLDDKSSQPASATGPATAQTGEPEELMRVVELAPAVGDAVSPVTVPGEPDNWGTGETEYQTIPNDVCLCEAKETGSAMPTQGEPCECKPICQRVSTCAMGFDLSMGPASAKPSGQLLESSSQAGQPPMAEMPTPAPSDAWQDTEAPPPPPPPQQQPEGGGPLGGTCECPDPCPGPVSVYKGVVPSPSKTMPAGEPFHALAAKCQVKDKIIECLLERLVSQDGRAEEYQQLLVDIASGAVPRPQPSRDYQRADVAEILPRPAPPSAEARRSGADCGCGAGCRSGEAQGACEPYGCVPAACKCCSGRKGADGGGTQGQPDSAPYCACPFKFRIRRRIGVTGLIVEWTPPKHPAVCGYEIFVDGEMKYRARSRQRNMAFLDDLDLSKQHEISLQALVCEPAACQQPTTALYETPSQQYQPGEDYE